MGEVEALPEASSFQLKSRQALPTPAGQGRQLCPDSASSRPWFSVTQPRTHCVALGQPLPCSLPLITYFLLLSE